MRHLALAAVLAVVPIMGAAEDAAIILGIERYEQLGRLSRAEDAVDAAGGLEALGFAVTAVPNARSGNAMAALGEWQSDAVEAERLVAVLTGRFVTDGDRTWLLTADMAEPSLFSLGDRAVSVESVLQVLGQRPGQSILLIGTDDDDRAYPPFLRLGVGELTVPQGVLVVTGTAPNIARFAERALALPEADLMQQVRDYRRLEAQGYVPETLVLMPAVRQVTPDPEPVTGPDEVETALWEGAMALDTAAAYRDYLSRYPRGFFTDEAEEAIAAILAEPNRSGRLTEEALGLDRRARREVQRDLTLLDFNTRGIDGIFGPGTRRAIANWQQQNGFAQTTYLTREQLVRLDAQATRRAAEIEAEAERQRAEQARQDRAFWDETGARGDEPGLRAYLERFPDGLYSDFATQRLGAIEEEKRRAAAAEDRAAWDSVRSRDTVEAYSAYLLAYPRGGFRSEAEARLEELTAEQERAGDNRAAAEQERALGLNSLTSRLVESRLEQLGLNPGPVDGDFTRQTRRAIRNYQRDRDLEVSGFLNEATLIRILADSFEVQR